MKTKVVLAVILSVVASASGCKKSENSLTGPPSTTRVLSGQVVTVGDLAGSSPAGISVTSTGQVAVTDAAGRFGFMSLPSDNVQLTFTRADGIAAATTINTSSSRLIVELQRSRAVARGQSKREIEGLIVEVSATSITVDDARTHGPVTATIDATTVIRKGNQTLTTADLKAGDRVHVKASVATDGALAAFEIMLQHSATTDPGDGAGQIKELEGPITAISPTSITVNNASTGGPVSAAITSSTVIRRGNKRLTTTDLKVGDRVHVKTEGPKDALVATQITLQNPAR